MEKNHPTARSFFKAREAILIGKKNSIGIGTVIDPHVIIGYPTRKKVKSTLTSEKTTELATIELTSLYGNLSEGANIGARCIIRAHTIIYENVTIGNNVETGTHVVIREHATIGDNTIIGSHTVIDGNVKVGRKVSIQSGVYIPPKTIIGNNVFLGPMVMISNDKYPASKRLLGVTIKDDVIIGLGAQLISGITIHEGAIIGAGAVVTKDVPPNSVVIGVPARVVSNREEYLKRQKEYERQGETP